MRDNNTKQVQDVSSATNRRELSRLTKLAEPRLSCCSGDSEKAGSQVNEKAGMENPESVSFNIDGMSCASCVRRIEKALTQVPGVSGAHVNFYRRQAVVTLREDVPALIDDLRAAVEAEGYRLLDTGDIPADQDVSQEHATGPRPYLLGVAVSLGLVAFYLGLLTLTSDWYNARLEFREYGIWILTLALGLGVQTALFMIHRARCRGKTTKAAKYGLAASGGMSTTAMAACCAHYLVIILPAIGLPFLSTAAAALATYQVYFFMAGVISNLFGIGMMIRMMRKSGVVQWRVSMSRFPFCFKKVTNRGGI